MRSAVAGPSACRPSSSGCTHPRGTNISEDELLEDAQAPPGRPLLRRARSAKLPRPAPRGQRLNGNICSSARDRARRARAGAPRTSARVSPRTSSSPRAEAAGSRARRRFCSGMDRARVPEHCAGGASAMARGRAWAAAEGRAGGAPGGSRCRAPTLEATSGRRRASPDPPTEAMLDRAPRHALRRSPRCWRARSRPAPAGSVEVRAPPTRRAGRSSEFSAPNGPRARSPR